MINYLKKYAAQFIAAVVLVAGIAVPVAAATNEISVEPKGGSTPYIDYTNLKMYSGIVAYTSSATCTSQKAAVKLTKVKYSSDGEKTPSDSTAKVSVSTYAASNNSRISTPISIQASTTTVDLPSAAASYPSQSIKAGFSKSSFNGVYYLTGIFYYNGT